MPQQPPVENSSAPPPPPLPSQIPEPSSQRKGPRPMNGFAIFFFMIAVFLAIGAVSFYLQYDPVEAANTESAFGGGWELLIGHVFLFFAVFSSLVGFVIHSMTRK